MNAASCLLISALALGQPTSRSEWQLAPQLASGLELVYAGAYTEETLIPNVQFQRHYHLDALVLVLDPSGRAWDVAFMTTLTARSAEENKANKPSSVRLEVGQVDSQGKLVGANARKLLAPLDGPPLLEAGCFIDAPRLRLTKNSTWEVNEADRPPRSWQVVGLDTAAGVTCLKVVGKQQSRDWDQPRADQTGWRRRDTVWINPQLGVAEKVERVIERRAPARTEPTHRLTVQYQLKSHLRYPGRLYEDRKQEILNALRLQEDAAALLRQPAQHRTQLESLIKKVSLQLDNQPPTPYRKALFHLAGRLESARHGDTAPEPVAQGNVPPPAAVGVGQRVPDFVVSEIAGSKSARLSKMLGRPILVVFYNPSTDIGREVMMFARGMAQQHGVAVMAMAVGVSAETALKQQRELQLPFAILDGGGMRLTFAVEATPRLVLLDHDGILRSAHTGWGPQVPREIQEELARLRKR